MLYFILELVGLSLVLLAGAGALYLFAKKNKRVNFRQAFEAVVVYVLVSAFVRLFFPSPISLGWRSVVNLIVSILLLTGILYFVFYFVMNKFISFGWKKSLTAFLILSIIVFPMLDYGRILLSKRIMDLPAFEREVEDMDFATIISLWHRPLESFDEYPGLVILNSISKAIRWVPNYIQQLVVY